jgi:hypothetical protein
LPLSFHTGKPPTDSLNRAGDRAVKQGTHINDANPLSGGARELVYRLQLRSCEYRINIDLVIEKT